MFRKWTRTPEHVWTLVLLQELGDGTRLTRLHTTPVQDYAVRRTSWASRMRQSNALCCWNASEVQSQVCDWLWTVQSKLCGPETLCWTPRSHWEVSLRAIRRITVERFRRIGFEMFVFRLTPLMPGRHSLWWRVNTWSNVMRHLADLVRSHRTQWLTKQ